MSTHSNDNQNNQVPASPTSPLEKQGTQSVSCPPILPLPRAEQAQDEAHLAQVGAIQLAFLSERTAADFMSIFSGDSPLTKRVQEMGNKLDALISARDDYFAQREEVNRTLQSLGSSLPRSPYLADMARKIKTLDVLPNPEVEDIIQQTPDRHLTHPTPPKGSKNGNTPPSHAQLRQSGILVKNNQPRPSQTTRKDTPPHPNTRRQTNRPAGRRLPKCPYCGGLGHQQTYCSQYYCMYCKTDGPGHFAKYCPRNPHQGIDRRDLSPNAMALLRAREELFSDPSSNSTPSESEVRALANTILSSKQSGLQTPPHSPMEPTPKSTPNDAPPRTPNDTPPRNVSATGPTYKPVLTAPKKPHTPGARKNLGRLRQLPSPPSDSTNRRNVPHQQPTPRDSPQPGHRSPTSYDGDYEDNFDNEGYYNIDGEGNL